MGEECPSDSDSEGALTNTAPMVLLSHSDRVMAETLPSVHGNSTRSNQDTQQIVNWRFCTMNMTAFFTHCPAVFELGCRVCGLQETRLTEAGQAWVWRS